MPLGAPRRARNLSTAQVMSPEGARATLRQWMGAGALGRKWATLIGIAVLGLLFATCGGDKPTAPAPAPTTPAPPPAARPQPPLPPPAPTGLHVSATTTDSVTWTWTGAEGATAYEVQISDNAVFDDTDAIKPTTETSYTGTGLSPETVWHLRVRAIMGTVEAPVVSAWSSHATGMAGIPPPPPGAVQLTITRLHIHLPEFPDAGFQIDDNVHFTVLWDGGNIELQGTATLSVVIGDEIRMLKVFDVGNREGHGWLYFRYVITAEDHDEDGFSIARDALELAEGSTIVDVSTQLPVSIDLGEHALENASNYKVRAQLVDLPRVAGLRVAEISQNSVLWVWEPTNGARNYQVRAILNDTDRDGALGGCRGSVVSTGRTRTRNEGGSSCPRSARNGRRSRERAVVE